MIGRGDDDGMPGDDFFGDEHDDSGDASDADSDSGPMPARIRLVREGEATTTARQCFGLGDHVELARALVSDLGGRADLVHDELHPWRYEATRGLWVQIDRSDESRIVQGYSGTPAGASLTRLKVKASDVSGAVKLAHDQIASPGFFAEAHAIAFRECVVRTTPDGIEVLPHAREHRARAGYPFPYERTALPRRFLSFLADLFRDDDDGADKTSFVQEFFGSCILGIAPRYQRACVATGEGDNGKSTLADLALASMPAGTTSAIAPQDWGNEYRRAMLVGKHLNAVGELPESDIIASDAFKGIITGDPIVGREIRESPRMFRPKAGHYFAANKLPGTSDQTEGFWRRFVVLTFNRSFKNDPARDPDMGAKLRAELPQIVSWMIDGAARLIREKSYTVPASHHNALAAWRRGADQVAMFVSDETRVLAVQEPLTFGTTGAVLYQAYRTWTERNGHRPMASNRFAERMQGLGLPATHTRRGQVYAVAFLSAADRSAV